jgi:N-acetylmuramoyl-L-alanine amidase
MKALLPIFILLSILSGCSSIRPFDMSQVDQSINAKSQDSRARFLIIHYTALDQARSLRVLSQQSVSSHYLVGDDQPTTVYQLVDENRLAHHAGVSSWKNVTQLNASSIGIEIVNLGYQDTPEGRYYPPFPQHQIDAVITLVKDIVARHRIKPENILGHAEIAPQRKPDPGPLFPWKQLANAGLVFWPDETEVKSQKTIYEQQLPDVTWFQKKLVDIGYATPQSGVWDKETANVLIAFQARYRPGLFDGIADTESAALLEIVSKQISKK